MYIEKLLVLEGLSSLYPCVKHGCKSMFNVVAFNLFVEHSFH